MWVRALRGLPLPGRLSTVSASGNFFNSLLAPCFVKLFSGNSSVNLFAVGWVIWPAKAVPEMTYNVFSGTLNPTHFTSLCCVPLQIQTFYHNLVLVAKYHVDCWHTVVRLSYWVMVDLALSAQYLCCKFLISAFSSSRLQFLLGNSLSNRFAPYLLLSRKDLIMCLSSVLIPFIDV